MKYDGIPIEMWTVGLEFSGPNAVRSVKCCDCQNIFILASLKPTLLDAVGFRFWWIEEEADRALAVLAGRACSGWQCRTCHNYSIGKT